VLHFIASTPYFETYSPSKAFSPLGIEKIHVGPYPVNRGTVALVGSDV